MDIEGLVLLKERRESGDRDTPTGFIVEGVRLVLFTTPKDVVWVGIDYGSRNIRVVEKLMKELKLKPSQAYPLVVEQPAEEVKEIWEARKR